MEYLISILFGYFLGSVPFGLVIAYLSGYGDIRKQGSGNIGTTNVLRVTKRKDLTLLTLILDAGKAGFAALLASWIFSCPLAGLFAGLGGVIGHNFPIWLDFKGGKGVASTLGMMLATFPSVGLAACLTWVFMAFVFRYSSLSALTALTLSPFYAYILGGSAASPYILAFAFLALLSMVRHRANIERLINKKESKINFKKKKQ
ncbi:MAG: glycerol-3-phosphate 1-O-acyltransferase PlsY [Alphaproteobacteria bacterium]|nr:glycerol-3-phosphate 1-O-acyltransferase PlsY [Alphaproteobacteria bacterium]